MGLVDAGGYGLSVATVINVLRNVYDSRITTICSHNKICLFSYAWAEHKLNSFMGLAVHKVIWYIWLKFQGQMKPEVFIKPNLL